MAVSSGKQPQTKVSAVDEERNFLRVKCRELGLEVLCMQGLAVEAKSMRACVAEMGKVVITKGSKVQT